MSRKPSPPPELPGFRYLQALGTGGFADVFLYEQEMPRRRVAVKVLLADRLSSGAAAEFAEEANVMAMLSTHPAIVTIYQAGVAGDGRPYLVMEYCPRPNLQLRSRREPFSVAEALRVGVQVAGAVETAHRAGVLHRDIKPANILVTEYNRPALTDFGIASTIASTPGAVTEATGMSIPWSPPESFADPPTSGPRSDVWALGATVFTLLVGRSPFERAGERNTSVDLIERIERAPLAPLGRADAPASLHAVLERAMAKRPDDRYASAVAFARALQKVQIELAHSVTPIDIVDDQPVHDREESDDDGLTRVRGIVDIGPDTGRTRPSAVTRPVPGQRVPAEIDEATVARPLPVPEPEDDRTVLRGPVTVHPEQAVQHAPPPASPGAPAPTAPPAAWPQAAPDAPAGASAPDTAARRRRGRRATWTVLGVAAAAIVVVGGIVAANLFIGAPDPEPDPEASTTSAPQDVTGNMVQGVTELVGSRDGGDAVFTWTNPDPQEGDGYFWTRVTLAGGEDPQLVDETSVRVPGDAEVCIDVQVRRADGRTSDAVRGCVP